MSGADVIVPEDTVVYLNVFEVTSVTTNVPSIGELPFVPLIATLSPTRIPCDAEVVIVTVVPVLYELVIVLVVIELLCEFTILFFIFSAADQPVAVSYTHLTLPTNREV